MSLVEPASKLETICEWKIDKFALLSREETLLSPTFQMYSEDDVSYTRWILVFSNKCGYIFGNLVRRQDKGPKLITLFYEISVVANDGSSVRVNFTPRPCSFYKGSHGDTTITRGLYANDFLVNGTLTLRCQMWGVDVIYPMYWLIRTNTLVQKKFFKWSIEGFSSPKTKEYIINFFHNDIPKRLKVSLSKKLSDDEILIEINRMEKPEKQFVICEVCLLNFEGNVVASKKDLFTFYDNETWRFPTFMSNESLLKNMCVLYDTMSLRFEITNLWQRDISGSVAEIYFGGLSDSTSSTSGCSTSTIQTSAASNTCVIGKVEETSDTVLPVDASGSDISSFDSNPLVKGLLGLYQQQKFCDGTLKTNDSSFLVHRAVLCAQSSVFTAMFEKDSQSAIVEVTDLTDVTVQEMILFMYTDTVQNMRWDSAQALYAASDKYDISRLKNLCRSFLIGNMSVSNVTDALLLAHLHEDPELNSVALDFFLENDQELIDSDVWKSFMQEQLKLAAEIMYLLYKRKMRK